ncbi:zinc finger protein 708-like isoform X2 [Centruroides sculpturatus]|uniref:zinc finger protein 708-like isoform X1 n=1 Tax=Centruroides sculpturatus TaxID=218467 RepID=UPI000C6EEB26|nr:zinc finger protein 708-like isoform X1 [Centruroides sculpturatus]XP_023211566.1 zinc finger protein 708-like isoform X2 [Centruroides sculpturatus]
MHVLEFRNLRNVPYRCEWCGKTFNTESELQQHINKEHKRQSNGAGSGETSKYEVYLMDVFDDVVYKCRYCGMEFKTESDLADHIKEWHTPITNGAGSDGSFKYNKHWTTCGEPFNADQNIPLSDSTSCEMFLIFEKLRTYFEKSEELKSETKTDKECFKILRKSKYEKDIKDQGPENKQNNESDKKQDPARHQKCSPASAEKQFSIEKLKI